MTYNLATGMMLRFHLGKVLDALHAEGIECSPVKGAALAHRLYGDELRRDSNDIDILVHPSNRTRALALLTERRGYRVDRELVHGLDHHDSLLLTVGSSDVHLELHTSFEVGGRKVFPGDWWVNRVSIQMEQRTASIFRDDHLLVYLCVHASAHGYACWGWLVDIKDLMAVMTCTSAMVIQAARAVECSSTVYHTLSLLQSLGADVPSDLLRELKPHRDNTWLIRLLVFRGPRFTPGFGRLVSFLVSDKQGGRSTYGRFFPPYREFRRRYQHLPRGVARILYPPWIVFAIGRAAVSLIRVITGFRHN